VRFGSKRGYTVPQRHIATAIARGINAPAPFLLTCEARLAGYVLRLDEWRLHARLDLTRCRCPYHSAYCMHARHAIAHQQQSVMKDTRLLSEWLWSGKRTARLGKLLVPRG
jgi:hypothetical protein